MKIQNDSLDDIYFPAPDDYRDAIALGHSGDFEDGMVVGFLELSSIPSRI